MGIITPSHIPFPDCHDHYNTHNYPDTGGVRKN